MNSVLRYGLLMILALVFITACTSNQDLERMIPYENVTSEFSLEIPKSWEEKYVVQEEANRIVFAHRASRPGGILFIIEKWSRDKWSEEGEALSQIIHLSKLGEKNDTIFSWATPTDVQYTPEDEASKQEYLEMFTDVESIKSSFQLKE